MAVGRADEAAAWFAKAAEGGNTAIRRRIAGDLMGYSDPRLRAAGMRALKLCVEEKAA